MGVSGYGGLGGSGVGGDFLKHVPQRIAANLEWREKLWRAACDSRGVRDAIRYAMFHDVLFWFDAVSWCFEPRSIHKVRPFVTWVHQKPVIEAMDRAISKSERSETPIDLVVDKSRGQGATWMYLLVCLRRWLRDPLFSVGLVTRNEDLVDSKTDPDTLLWKLDWELHHLPEWMLPVGFDFSRHRSITSHSISNPENGSTIVGYSATGDVGRGGRKTVFCIDEIGSEEFIRGGKDYAVLGNTQHITNCRFLVSTYGSDVGAFYDAAQSDSSATKLILDWKDNPTQNRLMYILEGGRSRAVKPAEDGLVLKYVRNNRETLDRLERRGHAIQNKVRSPWYDQQCLRPGATPRSIAKELDRNPSGVIGKVFDQGVLDRMKFECTRKPIWRGRVIYDNESLEVKGFVVQDRGPLKLWFMPGLDLNAPRGRYAVGCDLSAGVAGPSSSNSVACGIDRDTGEQIMEYATPAMIPTLFARLVVSLCIWLKRAYLAWEATGPCGTGFGREIVDVIGYGNYYERSTYQRYGGTKKMPGWWNTSDDVKAALFDELNIAMDADEFTPRSADLIRECGEYEWDKGKIVHRPTKGMKTDMKAHGDRCVAAGVAWLAVSDRRSKYVDKNKQDSQDAPYGSWGWREQQELREQRKWTDDEPQFSLKDLLNTS